MGFWVPDFYAGVICGAVGLFFLVLVLHKLGWLGDSKADD